MKTLVVIISLSVLALAALPELKVSTKDGVLISSASANKFEKDSTAKNCQNHLTFTHTYVPMTSVELTGHEFSVSYGSIRGRGNSTWAGDKKPYRIKFDESQSMFGSKKHKSWALLANWYDQTFALNAVGFRLGKIVGIPGTPNQYLVDFYLNNEYKGIYQITDLVQVNKGRLEIDENEGWLVEFDYHCSSDLDEMEIDFATDYPNSPSGSKLHTFIKSPEGLPNKLSYDFVKNDVKNLTSTMFNKSGFPENGYRDLVDLESVAKYLMLEQFLDNFDFNNKSNNSGFPASNFFHKDKGGKIKGGPIWDLDLIGGVEYNTFPKHFTTSKTPIMPRHAFYKKFFDDPVFKAKFKKNWDKYKPDIQAMSKQGGFIDSIAGAVEGSVVKNFELQLGSNKTCNDNGTNTCKRGAGGFPNMAPIVLGNLQAYRDEVAKLKTWWNDRVKFFDEELTKMNIDISKDIEDLPLVTLTCTVIQDNVEKGATIVIPDLTCSDGSPAKDTSWTGRPGGNSSWAVSATTSTPSYNIGVKATCGSAQNLTATCGTVAVVEPVEPTDPTPIRIGNTIVQLPSNAKIEVYNLQGKLIYTTSGKSLNRENRGSDNLQIPVQTKGVYIIRVKKGNSAATYQNRIYLN